MIEIFPVDVYEHMMLLFFIRICSVGTKANNCKFSSTLDKEYEYEYRSWNVLAHADLLVVYWLSCWILWSVVTLLWQGTCNCSALPDYQAGDKERHLYTVCKHAAIYMPWPGFEPGLLRPQRNVLTTIRSRHCLQWAVLLKSTCVGCIHIANTRRFRETRTEKGTSKVRHARATDHDWTLQSQCQRLKIKLFLCMTMQHQRMNVAG